MKRFVLFALILSLCTAVFGSCGEPDAESEVFIPVRTGAVANYETVQAVKGTILEQVTLEGGVSTPYTRDLSFTLMSGTISSFDLHVDQEVHEGDVIAVLDSTELEDEIVIQQLRLDSARTTYENLQAQHASEEDIEFARIDYQIEQTKYDTLVGQRDFLVLKAPFDGHVVSIKNYRVGSHINKNTPICTISDSSKVRLAVTDYDSQLTDVSFGTRVDIYQGALIATTGKVIDIITTESTGRGNWGDWGNWGGDGGFNGFSDGGSATNTIYVIQCDGDIEFSDLGSVSVTFTTLRRDDAIIVPYSAIFEATDTTSNLTSSYVNVLLKGIKVQTPVTVGVVSSDGRAEIVSGLTGGETIILP